MIKILTAALSCLPPPRPCLTGGAAFLLFLLCCASAGAQTVEHTENKPDQALKSEARVDPSTHGMALDIPLANLPGRAGAGLPVALTYSSKVWRIEYTTTVQSQGIHHPQARSNPRFAEHSAAGWTTSLAVPRVEFTGMHNLYGHDGLPRGADFEEGESGFEPRYYLARLHLHLPDGSSHELMKDYVVRQFDGEYDFSGLLRATDGSRIAYDNDTKTLYLPDGSRYVLGDPEGWLEKTGQPTPDTLYIDRHGNRLTYSFDHTTGARRWKDTLGRTLNLPLPRTPARGDVTYSLPNAGGGAVDYIFRWRNLSEVLTVAEPPRYAGRQRCQAQYQTHTAYLFDGDSWDSVCSSQLFDPVVLAEIELPTGQQYRFTYNVFGEIDKVSFPTGGYERFRYEAITPLSYTAYPYSQANRGVAERWVSASGVGGDESHWQYGATTGAFYTPPYTAFTVAPDGTRSERVLWMGGSGNGYSPPFGFDDTRTGVALEERVCTAPAGQTCTSGGQVLRRKLTEWAATTVAVTFAGGTPSGHAATRDPRVTKEVSLVLDTGGDALSQTTAFMHDADLNVTSVASHDYAAVNQTTAQTGAISAMPQGALLRKDETTYLVNDPNVAQATRNAYRARNLVSLPSSTRVKNAAGAVAARSEVRYDEAGYAPLPCGAAEGWSDAGTNVRGVATTSRWWLDTTDTWVETHAQNDQCGSPRKSWDAHDESEQTHGRVSEVEYSPGYHYAYPTLRRSAVPDPSGQYGSATALVTETGYDFSTGQVLWAKDANGQVTAFSYRDDQNAPDPLGRLRKVTAPGGGWTKYDYGATPGDLFVRTRTALDQTRSTDAYQYFDGLGRPYRTQTYENQVPSAAWIIGDTEYDSMGRVKRASLPYRAVAGALLFSTDKWTETAYDALGRILTVTTRPDNAVVKTDYSGNRVLVTDQANKQRIGKTDALGRLVEVWEVRSSDPPSGTEAVAFPTRPGVPTVAAGYRTAYAYDVSGNLRKVAQGTQLRFFAYDSLGRLVRAKNPEQGVLASDADFPALTDATSGTSHSLWSMGYLYDAGGNLTKRKDARNVVTTYGYDNLNRNTTVRYTDGTKDIDRHYDNAVNGRGRFHYFNWDAANNTRFETHLAVDEYDAAGRPKNYRQHFLTNGVASDAFNSAYTYDLAGNVTSQTYPSGHAVHYRYDIAGRLADRGGEPAFKGTLGDGTQRTYSSGISYDELGGMSRERFGTQTPLYHRRRYNVRGQLYDTRLGTVDDGESWNRGQLVNHYGSGDFTEWGTSGPDNNGNVLRTHHFIPDAQGALQALHYQDYEYDALNRLTRVTESTSGSASAQYVQQYDYDRWGNRTVNGEGTWLGDLSAAPSLLVNEQEFDKSDLAATNRLYAPGDTALPEAGRKMRYDSAGNLVYDIHTGQGTRAYDAEGRMTQAQFVSGQVQTALYTYDADGRRVKRKAGSGAEVWQVYGAGGELLAEYAAHASPLTPRKEYGYRSGELLVTAEAGTGSGVAPQPVTWQNAVSASASSNSLTKTGAAGWNAGASSAQSIASGDGFIEFTAGNVSDRMCGLSQGDSSQHYNDIDFALYPNAGGYVDVYEGGVIRWGGVAQYQAGDRFRVAVEGSLVKYYKVGSGGALTLLYTSGTAPQYPLVADTSLHATGAQVTNVTLAGGPTGAVTVGNAGFEAPSVGHGAYQYRPTGGAWTFAGGAGVTGNASGFTAGNPAAPEGVQVGFIQGGSTSSMMQAVGGLQPGTSYTVWFKAARRGNCCGGGGPDFDVYLDQTLLGTFAPVGTAYQQVVTASFTATAGTQVLKFVGRNSAGGDNTAYIDEVQVRTATGAAVKWLVTDQLGTPRMVVDESGALAGEKGIRRHDYLPFGQQITAGVGGRTTNQGYAQFNDDRKKWAKLERDDETGLDYAQARYYSSAQGRFTSPDEFTGGPEELYCFADDAADNPTFYGTLTNPQSLNKYQYAYNNPLRYIDPTGHEPDDLLGQGQQGQQPPPPVSCAYCSMEERQRRYEELERWNQQHKEWRKEQEKRETDALAPPPAIPPAGIVTPVAPQAPPSPTGAGHKSNRRRSNREKHQGGNTRRSRDQGGEKADQRREGMPFHQKRPKGWKGPWPPKPPKPPEPAKPPEPPEPKKTPAPN